MPSNGEVPPELAPKLIHRFMSNEGYELRPGASEVLRYLRESSRKNFDSVIVGVITNSDPRVPEVLSSLGLCMSPLRYGTRSQVSRPTCRRASLTPGLPSDVSRIQTLSTLGKPDSFSSSLLFYL